MKCAFCKTGNLMNVSGRDPWNIAYLICDTCDSTYNNFEENMKEIELEKFVLKYIEDWIKAEVFPPTVKELKKTFPDLFDFELEYLIKEAERRASCE